MIKINITYKSRYGGYASKVYTFFSMKHFERWMDKWAVKMGVDRWDLVE